MINKRKIIFNVVMIFDFMGENTSINGGFSSFEENISKHVNMCDLLLISLQKQGFYLRIATNDLATFKKYSKPNLIGKYYEFIALDISSTIPRNINFFASMHKLELAKLLSGYPPDEYNFIIDNDCVLINELTNEFHSIIERGIPCFYNITNQVVPAYGRNSVSSDINKITGEETIGAWMGGEIIGGTQQLYLLIYDIYQKYIHNFISCLNELKQKSDENFYSIAYEYLIKNNLVIQNIGTDLTFQRFWCVKTLHFPEHWKAVKENSILHFPSSKTFLSSYLEKWHYEEFSSEKFISSYEEYLSTKNYDLNVSFFKPKKEKSVFYKFKKRVKKLFTA